MKNHPRDHLQLVTTQSYSGDNMSESINSNDSIDIDNVAMLLAENKTTQRASSKTILSFLTALKKSGNSQTIVQRSQDMTVELLNKSGDASVTLFFDIANFGSKTISSRRHRLWFTTPQEDINLSVTSKFGTPLSFEVVDSSASFRELQVFFQKPIGPADVTSYFITYDLKETFVPRSYFDITARTITSRISFAVIAPPNTIFDLKTVSLETADGFQSDSPPLLTLTCKDNQQKISWQSRNPKLGDQFRTAWKIA